MGRLCCPVDTMLFRGAFVGEEFKTASIGDNMIWLSARALSELSMCSRALHVGGYLLVRGDTGQISNETFDALRVWVAETNTSATLSRKN